MIRFFSSPSYYKRRNRSLRRCARRRGIEHVLTHSQLRRIINGYATGCPRCGVQFTRSTKKRKDTPTIDRINREMGYVDGNIQILCSDCNSHIKHNEELLGYGHTLYLTLEMQGRHPAAEGLLCDLTKDCENHTGCIYKDVQ